MLLPQLQSLEIKQRITLTSARLQWLPEDNQGQARGSTNNPSAAVWTRRQAYQLVRVSHVICTHWWSRGAGGAACCCCCVSGRRSLYFVRTFE
jgi:hypothetical protein